MPVGPGVKVDITSAVMFGSVLVLEPGEAALAAVAGRLGSNLLIRFWGDELHLPGYKYPFYKYPLNLTETALSVDWHRWSSMPSPQETGSSPPR